MLVVFKYLLAFLAILTLYYEIELSWKIFLELLTKPLVSEAWEERFYYKDANID